MLDAALVEVFEERSKEAESDLELWILWGSLLCKRAE